METDLGLEQKRSELKNEITSGINKTPMARLLRSVGRVIQTTTRYPKPLPLMFEVIVLALTVLMLLGLNFMVLFRGTETGLGINLVSAIIVAQFFLLTVVLTYVNINKALVGIRDTLVDFILSPKDLSDLHQWLSLGWSSRIINRFFFWWTIILVGGMSLLDFFVTGKVSSVLGLQIPFFASAFLGGVAFYYAPFMLLLPFRLQFYQFKLYENDPVHSEIIENISAILNRYVYGYVFINALLQVGFAAVHLPVLAEIAFMVVFGWVPVIAQYMANQVCIRRIISRSKRKTLNRIQAEIQVLQEDNIKNKENIEAINRLMDYHERIRVTPNSNLALQSIGNFLNQLALPLLGFLLGNIDMIIDLFR